MFACGDLQNLLGVSPRHVSCGAPAVYKHCGCRTSTDVARCCLQAVYQRATKKGRTNQWLVSHIHARSPSFSRWHHWPASWHKGPVEERRQGPQRGPARAQQTRAPQVMMRAARLPPEDPRPQASDQDQPNPPAPAASQPAQLQRRRRLTQPAASLDANHGRRGAEGLTI